MALNRYLYPQKGTNIVQQVNLSTRVNIANGGAVGTIVCGQGITVTAVDLVGSPGLYTVTLDNASSVSNIVVARAGFISAYAPASHIQFHVTAVTTTGCTIQAYQASTGATGNVNVAGGSLWIDLICTLSAVPA